MDTLYQKQILAFAQQSRASLYDESAALTARRMNPVCGDRVDLSLNMTADKVTAVGTRVRGCALCEAGAGLAITCLHNCTPQQIMDMTHGFTAWITKQSDTVPVDDMEKFMPVRDIRNRHKCVLLAFDAALAALTEGG